MRSLSLHALSRRTPPHVLQAMLDRMADGEEPDVYGVGGAVTRLEDRIAALLGKEAAVLHGLTGHLLGDADRLVTTDDLLGVREPLAAVLLELPQRDLGGLLPQWDDLVAQTTWARERGIATHMDGARLWEAQPYYERPHAEIAALFDTVYVSLYKGLEGLAGALLAGPADHVAQAREWRARLGGQVHNAWPLAVD